MCKRLLFLLSLTHITSSTEKCTNTNATNYYTHECDFANSNIFRDVYNPDEHATPSYEEECLKTFPIIIPIGCDCRSTSRLRFMGIRKLAHPFDWYQSSLDTIYNCIFNDFAYFTDEKYIKNYTHPIYGIFFTHDFSWNSNYNQKRFNNELFFMKKNTMPILNNSTMP